MKKMILQFFIYLAVGLTSTGFDYGAYYLLTRHGDMSSLAANPVAYMAGNVISFFGHRVFTFHSRGNPIFEYIRFIIVTGFGLGVSQLVLWACLKIGFHDLLAKGFSVFLSGFCNYLANRFWTFRPTGGRP